MNLSPLSLCRKKCLQSDSGEKFIGRGLLSNIKLSTVLIADEACLQSDSGKVLFADDSYSSSKSMPLQLIGVKKSAYFFIK